MLMYASSRLTLELRIKYNLLIWLRKIANKPRAAKNIILDQKHLNYIQNSI